MQLHEWQRELQGAMLDGRDRPRLRLLEGNLSRAQSVAIYSNAYRARLCEALRSNYSALHRLLGDRDFDAMADQFAAEAPPCAPSIRWFGAALPDFLARREPYRQCPAIAELATFEWALRHTVDAADETRVDAAFLQAREPALWAELRFALHPSLSLLGFSWNAPQIWRALEADEEPPLPLRADGHWLVYRDADLVSVWRSAEQLEIDALQVWRDGGSFGAICELLLRRLDVQRLDVQRLDAEDVAAAHAAGFLQCWLREGLLVLRQENRGPIAPTGEKP